MEVTKDGGTLRTGHSRAATTASSNDLLTVGIRTHPGRGISFDKRPTTILLHDRGIYYFTDVLLVVFEGAAILVEFGTSEIDRTLLDIDLHVGWKHKKT